MTLDLNAKAMDWILRSKQFDPDWYRRTYPDVAAVGMAPLDHFRTYGRLMGRAPNARLAADPLQLEAAIRPAPRAGAELLTAHRLAAEGGHDLALAFARMHMPAALAHTVEVLEANRALAQGRRGDWLRHLNGYLSHYGIAPVTLRPGGALIDRLSTDPVAPVTEGPLVSVIMPAWNAEASIAAAAASVLAQSWRNIELLIVDDASSDGTWSVMQGIAARDPRVRIWRNSVNVGPYVSKNIALTQARGDWITGHDADDWAHPERIARHMDQVLASKGAIRASLTRMVRMTPEGAISVSTCNDFAHDGVAKKASISCLYQRGVLDLQLGFWESVRIGADSEMIDRATMLLGEGFRILDQIGMLCFDIPTSLTNNAVYGVDVEKRDDHPRTLYRAAWIAAHQSMTDPADFHVDFPQTRPRHAIPDAIRIEEVAVMKNLPDRVEGLRRIVSVVFDASAIGGVPTRVRKTLANAAGRAVEYMAISNTHSRPMTTGAALDCGRDPAAVAACLDRWSPLDTVIVVSNNAMRDLPADIRNRMERFPIVYWSASQLAFMIQDSSVLQNRGYAENLRASRIVCMSQMDIDFQRQLGLRGQVKGFAPVELRPVNDYDPARNTLPTFVGRIDFHAKDCERLIDIAQVLQRRGGPRLRVFTTDGRNSPEYDQFVQMAEARGVMDQLELHLNVEDKDVMFGGASLLLLPSKKEAFGNVILEAYSHGVPVVGASYAPGPAELIRHGQTGLLVEDFTDAEAVAAAIEALGRDDLIRMSRAAFEAHKDYSMDRYYDFLESVCAEVLEDFDGRNSLPVLPRLKMLQD